MRSFRRHRGERGASAVEFALTAPLLLILLLGCVELSLFMKDYISMSSSVRSGARAASAAADGGPGTCPGGGVVCVPANVPAFAQGAADSMQTAGLAMPKDAIDHVLIYRVPNGSVGTDVSFPTSCSTNCVKFTWNDAADRFQYASGSWASASVNACLNDKTRDSVGIALQARHDWFTPLIGDLMGGSRVMQEQSIMQFEPLEHDRCKPGTPNAHQ